MAEGSSEVISCIAMSAVSALIAFYVGREIGWNMGMSTGRIEIQCQAVSKGFGTLIPDPENGEPRFKWGVIRSGGTGSQ